MPLFAPYVSQLGVRPTGPVLRWAVVPGWEERIKGLEGLDFSNLDHDPRATLVKSNPIRRVWRVCYQDGVLYVKEFLETAMGTRLRRLLHCDPALQEWRAGQAAARRQVPCVRFLGLGRGRNRGFLVSQGLEGAVSLCEAWLHAGAISSRHLRRRRMGALVDATAKLIAKAHNRGFVHGDDHPRNLLVVQNDGESWDVAYVDVQRARWMANTPMRSAAQSLAQLHQWFQLRASAGQRWRFLRTYCSLRSNGDKPAGRLMMRRLAPMIHSATYTQMSNLWAKRDRRIGRTNGYFARRCLEDGSVALVALRCRQADLFPSPSFAKRSKDRHPGLGIPVWDACSTLALEGVCSSEAIEMAAVENGPTIHYRKTAAGWWNRVRWRLRGSPLRRAFVVGHRLRNRDLPCRFPLAVVEGLTAGREVVSRLWLDWHPSSVDLPSFMKDENNGPAQRRGVCVSLGRLVSLMADRGASVPRPRASTYGVVVDAWQVIIEEPLDVVLGGRHAERHRLVSVLGLYDLFRGVEVFRRTDAVRFLRELTRRDWKRLWRTVERTQRRKTR